MMKKFLALVILLMLLMGTAISLADSQDGYHILEDGLYIEFEAEEPPEDQQLFRELMEGTISCLETRLSIKGYTGSEAYLNGNTICVEIPDVHDLELINDLVSGGKIEFMDPDGNVFMSGDMIKTATYYYADGDHQVAFTLTEEGTKLFADATGTAVGKAIAIILDGEKLIAPTVQNAITNGSGVINGLGSAERATTIAAKIQSGVYPLKIKMVKYADVVSPERQAQRAKEEAKRAEQEAIDGAKPVIIFGDTIITKKRVLEETQNQLDSIAYMYQIYGMSFDVSDPDNIADAQDAAIKALKQDLVLTAKAKDLGLDALTDEEAKEVKAKAQEGYDYALDYVKQYQLTETGGLDENALLQAAEEELTKMGISLDSYIEAETKTLIGEKLREYVIRDVTDSDDETKNTVYNDTVAKWVEEAGVIVNMDALK